MYITDKEIELGKRESIADAARVLSRYLGGIVIRTPKHEDIVELAQYADIPIINALTGLLHPCQIMADILTVYEKLGRYEDFRIAYLGDGNNITNSWLNLSSLLGFQLVVATSPETLPDQDLIKKSKAAGKSEIIITDDPVKAATGAHVIYTDVWASMGQKDEAAKQAERLRAYQVNTELIQKADPNCIVLHCLPAERGREITDDVMDGPHSVVFDQAENRLHAQKAVMTVLVE
jgi:ornithine carbamoyltransferase